MTQNRQMTPMMRQYWEVKRQYPDAILFFRMGDFYEMFGEDAITAAPVLEIVLTSRDKSADEKVPMCGLPYHAVDSYVAKLIAKNYKVAICDQMEDPKTAKGIVKREIVRVITPGTLLETSLLEGRSNNFLASISRFKARRGLALLDLSTGEFLVTETAGAAPDKELLEEMNRWSPREVILPADWGSISIDPAIRLNPLEEWIYGLDYARDRILEQFKVASLEGFGLETMEAAVLAAGALLQYLQGNRVQELGHLTHIRIFHNQDFVYMDPASRRNLELTRSLLGGAREGSLLSFIDLTKTAMGGRLIKQRLEQPLRNPVKINERLSEVEAFYDDDRLRTKIRDILSAISDLERTIGRIATGVAHARDLVGLRESLARLPALQECLSKSAQETLAGMASRIDPLNDILEFLKISIADNPPMALKEGNIIRDGYDAGLDEFRAASRDGKSWIASLQARERERTHISSLKVSYNRVFGYYIEITNAHLSKIPEDYVRRQTMTNAERYITPELKEMEDKILGAEEKMAALEFEIFAKIRKAISAEVERIQKTAQIVAAIDVAAALADLAAVYRYRRPEISTDDVITITAGRHPVVERYLAGDAFVPNDVTMDCSNNKVLILTGPNMAGKSTYIRQVALIVLMAQMGSFVPAVNAHIGIVDRIFTRVGASDNLAGGQSTFMVEMNEAANILNNASQRSLIILDEIGRGTSTFDGLSIAWAVAEYLYKLGARTLFATHYHELTDLSDRLPGVKNYNVEVKEWNDQVVFLRKVVPGGVDRSYGIQVARLAGIPNEVIERAKEVLTALEMRERGRVPESFHQKKQPNQPVQLDLFGNLPSPVIEEIKTLQLDSLTPLDALNLIAKWKKDCKNN
jgi:DNA mismatch repair protein MutS